MAKTSRTRLCPQEIGAIKMMVGNKMSNGAIATALGLNKSTVAYAAAIARRAGVDFRKDGRGRPKLLSPRELRGLRRLVDQNPFASIADITESVNSERTSTTGRPALCKISSSTVRRAVKAFGLSSCTPAQMPYVSAANKRKRLQWGEDHLSWSYQWAWVLFWDESSFQVRQPQSRRVWRQRGQRFQTKNLRPTFKGGRESVMVWGASSARSGACGGVYEWGILRGAPGDCRAIPLR